MTPCSDSIFEPIYIHNGFISKPYEQSLIIKEYEFGNWYYAYSDFRNKLAYVILYLRDIVRPVSIELAVTYTTILYNTVYAVTGKAAILVSDIELYELITNYDALEDISKSKGKIHKDALVKIDYLFDEVVLTKFLFCEQSSITILGV